MFSWKFPFEEYSESTENAQNLTTETFPNNFLLKLLRETYTKEYLN